MLETVSRLPAYRLLRSFGRPRMLPLSLTVSLTYHCNSRCKTCRIYEQKSEHMNLVQYEKTFRSLGRAPVWITMSGGEPFLREDLPEICAALYKYCRPAVINIPTNGLLHRKIPSAVKAITASSPESKVIVNVSLDGVGHEHDMLRGVPGNYDKAIKAYYRLKELQRDGVKNLSLGIHTVISRFNVSAIPSIVPELLALEPDSYITEIAENRVELRTMALDITPRAEEYEPAIEFVMDKVSRRRFNGVGRLIQSFRLEYYQHVKSFLAGKPARWPCYAGFSSAQIMPDGEVWACCIKGDSMGNLQQANYEFPKVWFSNQAEQVRQTMKRNECKCPLANAAYTNMLLHPPTIMRIAVRALTMRRKQDLARKSASIRGRNHAKA